MKTTNSVILFVTLCITGLVGQASPYSKPTFSQVERCIGAVREAQGDTAAYTAACARTSGLYSYPTFSQVERLIEEVRKGTNAAPVDLSSRTTFAQVTNITDHVVSNGLSQIKINGQPLSTNASITTYASFKQAWVDASETNIAAFFAAVAADEDAKAGTAFLGGLKKNSTPTFTAQVEAELKAMKSAKDDSLIYVVTVYSTDQTPYFWFNMYHNGSVSGWRKYLQPNDVASWALKNSATPLTGVTINGTDLEVSDRKAVGTIRNPFPSGTAVGIGGSSVSTLTFCKSLATNKSVVAGSLFLGQVALTEAQEGVFPGCSEVTVKCLEADRDTTQPDCIAPLGKVLLTVDMTSTGTGLRHWMCVYELHGSEHPDRETYPDGKPAFGTTEMPWYGIPFRPFPGQEEGPNALSRDFTAALLSDVNACTNKLKNQYFSLSDEAGLKSAVKALVEALGGEIIP